MHINIRDASPSRICLVLISHLGEPISLTRLTAEVYDNAPNGRRGMPNRAKGRKTEFKMSNYREVQQTCNDLKKCGIAKTKKVGRESLVSLDMRGFISEIFKAKKGKKPLKNVVNKKKINWEGLIALMNSESDSDKRRRLKADAEEARAFRATSAVSLDEREINFLIKRINVDRLRALCGMLRKSSMLDYIGGQSNIVNLFIALIKGSENSDAYDVIQDNGTHSTLELLGLTGIYTTPITDTVIQSFIWRSEYPEVINFYKEYRPRY